MAVLLRLTGDNPPGRSCGPSRDKPDGYCNVHVGVQRGQEVVLTVPGDQELHTEIEIAVRQGRFSGPFVHGRNGERFVYLSWGELDGDDFRMFRRAKLQMDHLDADSLDGRTVEARLSLTDAKGHPTCASLRPPDIEWTVVG